MPQLLVRPAPHPIRTRGRETKAIRVRRDRRLVLLVSSNESMLFVSGGTRHGGRMWDRSLRLLVLELLVDAPVSTAGAVTSRRANGGT